MAWESRGNNEYYYRKQRIGDRVVSEYVGHGWLAEAVATLDEIERLEREQEREAWRQEQAEIRALEADAREHSKIVKSLSEKLGAARGREERIKEAARGKLAELRARVRQLTGEWRKAQRRVARQGGDVDGQPALLQRPQVLGKGPPAPGDLRLVGDPPPEVAHLVQPPVGHRRGPPLILEMKFIGASPRWMRRIVHGLDLWRLSVSKYVRGAEHLGDVPWNRYERAESAWTA